jgi:hypothetical protein
MNHIWNSFLIGVSSALQVVQKGLYARRARSEQREMKRNAADEPFAKPSAFSGKEGA